MAYDQLNNLRRWRAKNRAYFNADARMRYANRTPAQKERDRIRDREYRRKLRAKDREAYNARQRKWCRENPEKIKIRNEKWAKANPDKRRANKIRRRAKGGFSSDDICRIRALQKGKCAYCREILTPKIEHIDHIVPVAFGGDSQPKNIQLLCAPCNLRKHKREPLYHARQMGLLL